MTENRYAWLMHHFMTVIKLHYESVMHGVFKLKKIDVVLHSFRDW